MVRNYQQYYQVGQKVGNYTVKEVGSLTLIVQQPNGLRVPVIYGCVEEWINTIKRLMKADPEKEYNKFSSRLLRTEVKEGTIFSAHLHGWESQYRAFAVDILSKEL